MCRSISLIHIVEMGFYAPSNVSSLLVVFVGLLLYLSLTAVYRLCFSSISKFPGPKLAAVSLW